MANNDNIELAGTIGPEQFTITGSTGVSQVDVQAQPRVPTPDEALWRAVRNRTEAIGFPRFHEFMERIFCRDEGGRLTADSACGDILRQPLPPVQADHLDRLRRVGAYQVLRTIAETFLTLECGAVIVEPRFSNGATPDARDAIDDAVSFKELQAKLVAYLQPNEALPYLDGIKTALSLAVDGNPYCAEILEHRYRCPCMIELIWSYWHEQGMLVQAINAITTRFQNRRLPNGASLDRLTLAPLRPLGNLLWGYLQDESNRLTVARRAYEYDHEYGLRLVGRAVPELQPADSRSKFLEGFHNLLITTSAFYRQYDNKMVVADAFPVLNALKEVHLALAQGAHNQFGDLPWTARVEMIVQQWLLARPELREFLGGRPMVPYKEPWMGQVDAVKDMLGWGDASVTHFHDLAVFGEQVLLSVRYGDWTNRHESDHAKNWAVYWRPEIQGYLHAYRVVTGVDLSADAVPTATAAAAQRYLQPSAILQQRLLLQQRTSVPR